MEENIYGYVFHYNPMTQTWSAIPREHYLEYWSNPKGSKFLRSSDIKTLITLIGKGEKFIKTIKKPRAKTLNK